MRGAKLNRRSQINDEHILVVHLRGGESMNWEDKVEESIRKQD